MADAAINSPALKEKHQFQVKTNLGLAQILTILTRIQDLDGKLFNTDVNHSNPEWIGELVNDPQQRPKGIPTPLFDGIIYPSDLSLYLGSIWIDLKTYPDSLTLISDLDKVSKPEPGSIIQDLKNAISYLDNEVEKNEHGWTFTTDHKTQQIIIRHLIALIKSSLSLPGDLLEDGEKPEAEEQLPDKKTEEEDKDKTSSKKTTEDDAEDEDEGQDDGEEEKEALKPEDFYPSAQLQKTRKNHQKISIAAGFIYNHVIQDVANIYGVDSELFAGMPTELETTIRQQISSQIVANLYSVDFKSLTPAERLKLEKKILSQILLYNPTITVKLKQYLLGQELPQPVKEQIEKMDQLSDRFGQINNIRNWSEVREISKEEQDNLNDLAKTHSKHNVAQINAGFNLTLTELGGELNNPLLSERVFQVVDAKILTQQDPHSAIADPNLLKQLGLVKIDQTAEIALRAAIESYWYEKLAVYARVITIADPEGITALAIANDLDEEAQERQLVERDIISQRRDAVASYAAYHLSQEQLELNQDALAEAAENEIYAELDNRRAMAAQFIALSMKEQALRAAEMAAIEQKNEQIQLSGQPSGPIQAPQDTLPHQITPAMMAATHNAKRHVAAAQGQSLAKNAALQALATAVPHARVAMMLYNNRKKILKWLLAALAAALFILFLLLLGLYYFVGMMVLTPIGAYIVSKIWGKEKVAEVGQWTVDAISNLLSPSWWNKQLTTAAANVQVGATALIQAPVLITYGGIKWGAARLGLTSSGPGVAASSGGAGGLGVSVTQAAVGGTLATVGAASLMQAVAISPFLQPHPTVISTEETSQYVEISKQANVTSMENGDTRDIIYAFRITPRNGYIVTPVPINPIDQLSYQGGAAINLTFPQDCVIAGIGTEPITESKSFTCTLPHVSGTDVMVINTFIFNFTVQGESETVQTLKTTTSTRIGNPNVGCFQWADAGEDFHGVTTKSWSDADKAQIESAFSIVSNSAQYIQALCGAGDITFYRLNGYEYGGWAPSADGGSKIGIYDLGVLPGAMYSTRYTLIHELGHVIAYRNNTLLDGFLLARSQANCYSYNYICSSAECVCSGGEAFPEAIAIYVNWETFAPIHLPQFNLKTADPAAYNYLKMNLFDLQEYY